MGASGNPGAAVMHAGVDQPLRIDAYFDLVCPWCWIGRRHLADAVLRFSHKEPELAVETLWHGVQLLPDTPAEGLPYQAFYERRLGGHAAVVARRQLVATAGRLAGIEFRFDRIQTMPNTQLAHHLIRHLQMRGDMRRVDTMIERLFAAYFMDGTDIGDADELCRIAASHDLDASEMRRVLASAAQDRSAPNPGSAAISSVPHFVFSGGLAISGAQLPETLLALLKRSSTNLTDLQGIAT